MAVFWWIVGSLAVTAAYGGFVLLLGAMLNLHGNPPRDRSNEGSERL